MNFTSSILKGRYIKKIIAEYYQVDINSTSRERRFVYARWMGMLMCRLTTNLSYPQIAGLFNMRDHTTVIYGIKKVTEKMGDSLVVRRDYKILLDYFRPKLGNVDISI